MVVGLALGLTVWCQQTVNQSIKFMLFLIIWYNFNYSIASVYMCYNSIQPIRSITKPVSAKLTEPWQIIQKGCSEVKWLTQQVVSLISKPRDWWNLECQHFYRKCPPVWPRRVLDWDAGEWLAREPALSFCPVTPQLLGNRSLVGWYSSMDFLNYFPYLDNIYNILSRSLFKI